MKINRKKKLKKIDLLKGEGAVSATECTGLMPALPDTKTEEDVVKDIYDIP